MHMTCRVLLALALFFAFAPAHASSDNADVPDLESFQHDFSAQLEQKAYSSLYDANVAETFSHVDTAGVVPASLRTAALAYFQTHESRFANKNVITIVDFSTHSSIPRMYIINMKSGAVTVLHVAHGKGSDPKNSGYATLFGNTSGSDRSSLGFYATAESYSGKHGLSLRIDGLSSTNSRARSREIVVHGADYVETRDVRAGRSDGCFAVPMESHTTVVNLLKGGSMIYAGRSD